MTEHPACQDEGSIPDPENLLPVIENNPDKRNLRVEAERFIEEHPGVFRLFERFALEAATAGRKFGISLLTERVRWEVQMAWRGDSRGFRLNNNHRPYIARRLIERHPHLADLITCRRTVY